MTQQTDQLALPAISHASGEITLPGSKSISNRVLLLSALASGTTHLRGVLDSEDTRVMIEALRQLGIQLETGEAGEVKITGSPFFECACNQDPYDLYLANAGTAVRPLTAVLAVLGIPSTIRGVPRMHERPIGDLVDALKQAGAQMDYLQNTGYPPLEIRGFESSGTTRLSVKGTVSSQFLTALLMAAPLLAAKLEQTVYIDVAGELISKPYIVITLNLMKRFGVKVKIDNLQSFEISPESRYASPGELQVEGDASSASYFMAMGLLGKGPVRLHGLNADSIQGDIAFADFLQRLGANVQSDTNSLAISSTRDKALPAFDEDFNLVPDAAMTAAVLALFADGTCCLRNIASWRVKETDRLDAMHNELQKLGATVETGHDYIKITPPAQWQSGVIDTYDDHRMAMCFSLAAFGPKTVTINDPGCVRKTFPDYFSRFAEITS